MYTYKKSCYGNTNFLEQAQPKKAHKKDSVSNSKEMD